MSTTENGSLVLLTHDRKNTSAFPVKKILFNQNLGKNSTFSKFSYLLTFCVKPKWIKRSLQSTNHRGPGNQWNLLGQNIEPSTILTLTYFIGVLQIDADAEIRAK